MAARKEHNQAFAVLDDSADLIEHSARQLAAADAFFQLLVFVKGQQDLFADAARMRFEFIQKFVKLCEDVLLELADLRLPVAIIRL
jgi:hypothetical protein